MGILDFIQTMQKQRPDTETVNSSWWHWLALAVCALVIAIGYLRRDQAPQSSTSIPSIISSQSLQPVLRNDVDTAAVSEEQLKPLAATPTTLENSDGDVIVAANDLAAQLVQWLTPSEQIRKWITLVDQIADGKIPPYNRPLDYPTYTFEVEHDDGKLRLSTDNYQHADWLVGVVAGIAPIRLAHYYHVWSPALEKAHKELGTRGSFDKQLHKAIQNVLAAKLLKAAPELIQPGVYYQYTDPSLEKASDVEKLLWRMGPDNTQKLQRFLHELEPLL